MKANTKKDKRNAERGITLVALIITIIVLLILAGTTVSIAVSSSNIFSRATDAKDAWNAAVQNEEDTITTYVVQLDDY